MPHPDGGGATLPTGEIVPEKVEMTPGPDSLTALRVHVARPHLRRVKRQFQALLALGQCLGRLLALCDVAQGGKRGDDLAGAPPDRGRVDADVADRAVAAQDPQLLADDELTLRDGANKRHLLHRQPGTVQPVELPLPVVSETGDVLLGQAKYHQRLLVMVHEPPGGRLGDEQANRQLPHHRFEAASLIIKLFQHGLALALGPFALRYVAGDDLDRRAPLVFDEGRRAFHDKLLSVRAQQPVLEQRHQLPAQKPVDTGAHGVAVFGMGQLEEGVLLQRLQRGNAVAAERSAVGVDEMPVMMHEKRVRRHLHQDPVAGLALP